MLEYQTLLDGENMAQFWEYVRYFLFFIAPLAMIWFAADAIEWLIKQIREAFLESSEKKKEDDDDIYYY